MSDFIIRQATPSDTPAILSIMQASIRDLYPRLTGRPPLGPEISPEEVADWQRFRPIAEFLATHHYRWWVAEQAGHLIGHARSILMGDVLELTEFFVLPGAQSAGVGQALLAQVFPATGPDFKRRLIDATLDVRAQARYIKAGVAPRCPVYNLLSSPKMQQHVPTIDTDLTMELAGPIETALPLILQMDTAVLGVTRPQIHTWLLGNRDAYFYRRGGQVVGYGYVGRGENAFDGPFAVVDGRDFPAILNHWERLALVRGGEFGLEVPTIATEALHYLVGRGYRLEQFVTVLMADQPIGDFSRYILTSPPFCI